MENNNDNQPATLVQNLKVWGTVVFFIITIWILTS